MDHVTRQTKDEDKSSGSKPSVDVNEGDDNSQASYYYDDSSNYEIYRDADNDEDDSSLPEPSADRDP